MTDRHRESNPNERSAHEVAVQVSLLCTQEVSAFPTDVCLPRVCDWKYKGVEGSPLSRGNDPSNGAN
jgi:hypothetical protein